MAEASFFESLARIVGPTNVLTGELAAAASTDWTGRWTGSCLAVVRPGSTPEVAALVAACAHHRVTVVPQGGNTGLVGGAVPHGESVVVSTARLREIGEVDPVAGQVTAAAGVTIAELDAAARRAGWRYAVDFAARDTATVGGTVATNAGGHHVLRHGMTRRQVTGIEAVLADASVISHLTGLVKDNTGYDLAGLLCGSEGTLGIITAARLALVPAGGASATALLGFDEVDAAIGAVGELRRSVPEIEALELMLPAGMAEVSAHLGVALPVPRAGAYLLVEAVSRHDPLDLLAEALGPLTGVTGSAVASDSVGRAALWQWRELHTEVINRAGPHPPHKLDVSVPIVDIPRFVAELGSRLAGADPTARSWIFGHAGDGNLHVNVTGPPPDDDTVDEIVVELVASYGGSISAEHGIGRAKRGWLHLARSAEEIAAFRAIKTALDPSGLLNPGVLLPD